MEEDWKGMNYRTNFEAVVYTDPQANSNEKEGRERYSIVYYSFYSTWAQKVIMTL